MINRFLPNLTKSDKSRRERKFQKLKGKDFNKFVCHGNDEIILYTKKSLGGVAWKMKTASIHNLR